MTWEEWQKKIIEIVDICRKKQSNTQAIFDCVIINVFYQDWEHAHYYLTLPFDTQKEITTWLKKYIKDGETPFPLSGEIDNADVNFSIDFAADVEIVPSYDGTRKSNEQRGKDTSKENAADLPPNKALHRQEIINLYSKGKFDRMVKNGDIIHVEGKRGYYQRKLE